ncbi:unnamed protein product [Owenia fusiformis]|uniref:Uncharacterized protein n=1 Tax=Owenia fusiformis TaxID=6347 RepID=A0A8J1U4S7_OWEFU|nr:unnamed protein product [Owenia fusiformis]
MFSFIKGFVNKGITALSKMTKSSKVPDNDTSKGAKAQPGRNKARKSFEVIKSRSNVQSVSPDRKPFPKHKARKSPPHGPTSELISKMRQEQSMEKVKKSSLGKVKLKNKARKSMPQSPIGKKEIEDVTTVNLFPIANVSLKLPEIHDAFGIDEPKKTQDVIFRKMKPESRSQSENSGKGDDAKKTRLKKRKRLRRFRGGTYSLGFNSTKNKNKKSKLTSSQTQEHKTNTNESIFSDMNRDHLRTSSSINQTNLHQSLTNMLKNDKLEIQEQLQRVIQSGTQIVDIDPSRTSSSDESMKSRPMSSLNSSSESSQHQPGFTSASNHSAIVDASSLDSDASLDVAFSQSKGSSSPTARKQMTIAQTLARPLPEDRAHPGADSIRLLRKRKPGGTGGSGSQSEAESSDTEKHTRKKGKKPRIQTDSAVGLSEGGVNETIGGASVPSLELENGKFVNTPDGLMYPVTPPETPDHSHNNSPIPTQAKGSLKDLIPLCCCKITSNSYAPNSKGMYCQALDTLLNKICGCSNKVTGGLLVRPAPKVPFMAVCEVHRKRLKVHHCCPGCGHFCAQGTFYQCKVDETDPHIFHKQCQIQRGGGTYCPHCGEESVHEEVTMSPNDIRQSLGVTSAMEGSPNLNATARMGSLVKKGSNADDDDDATQEPPAIPLGPDGKALQEMISQFVAIKNKGPQRPKSYATSFLKAAATGELWRIIQMLGEGFNPNRKFDGGETALHAAASSGYLSIVHVLMEAGAVGDVFNEELVTPLMKAAGNNNVAVVRYLVAAGVVVDSKGEYGMSALHLASKAGHLDTIQYLLSTGKIDVNIMDDGGWSPIIWATEHKHEKVVKYLVKQGANPNLRDHEENTGLHWAAYSGCVANMELFLDCGCSPEAVNEHGDRPLHIASRQDHYEAVALLLIRGADSQARNNENELPINCCLDSTSKVYLALEVNKHLKDLATNKLHKPTRLLHRDVSCGKEATPIPCVNGSDSENFPQDYMYLVANVETIPMNINKIVTSIQYCKCRDECGSPLCVCGRNSIKCWYNKDGRLSDDFNMIEPPLIFECNKACACWSSCRNRVVQNGITCRMQLFKTVGRGWGVQTLLDIPRGSFICEYVGELIPDAVADEREDDSYLFDLDNRDGDTFCIDARKYGNVARFINHRCEPNIVPVKVFIDHQDLRFPRICFFASRDIKAGEELGFDYGEKFWMVKWKHFLCHCGSDRCKYSKVTIQDTLVDFKKRQYDSDSPDDLD